MCDVRNSTAAIEAGHYKNVNTVAAAVITAILNAAADVDIPFIFEGDGAMLCVPSRLLDASRAALLMSQQMAHDSFGIELRIATLPMRQIRAAGFNVLVARYQVSKNYIQAVFAGGGMAYAERYMKDAATAPLCAVASGSIAAHGNFDGLECRWRDIPSPYGEILSVMVQARGSDDHTVAATYRRLIAKVREVYGSDDHSHPVFPPTLAFSLDSMTLGDEVGVRVAKRSAFARALYLMKIRLTILLGSVLMYLGIKTARMDWGRYKTVLARNSDVRKVNDCFRQILAGTADQRNTLIAWLDGCCARGELIYGTHVSDRSQITCLVFDYAGRHTHFIDGVGGGLCMAAKALKARAMAISAP
jgi:hypothetical protein